MTCDCTHETGLPEAIRRGYGAACHILREGDTLVDGGCADGIKALAVRDHLRNVHGIKVTVIGIDNRPTGEMHDWLRSPEYDGSEDYDAETDATAKSRAALDRFVCAGMHEADIPEGSADVVTCISLGGSNDAERAAHAALAGFLKDGGTAVLSVRRPSRVADALYGYKLVNRLAVWLTFRHDCVRRALRGTEVRVMTKAEALEHAGGCGSRCAHGRMVDYY